MDELILYSVDISHRRLPQLMKLADAAEAFYRWVERTFRITRGNDASLSENLLSATRAQLHAGIQRCYVPSHEDDPIPSLYDGGGEVYHHRKACYFFFCWLLRDAPAQRLGRPLGRCKQQANARTADEKLQVEIEALVALFMKYRSVLRTFEWPSIREVACDRLEGSRRSKQGHKMEVMCRVALVAAIERFYKETDGYGVYASATVGRGQVKVDNETFDAFAELVHHNPDRSCKIYVSAKSRETEGGGHAHIFTRDMKSAVQNLKKSPNNYVMAFVIAQNWDQRELGDIEDLCDLTTAIQTNPNNLESLPADHQSRLDDFVKNVLRGKIKPKRTQAR